MESIPVKVSNAQESNPSWTWIDSEGYILASAGFIPIWPGLVEAWSIFSAITKYHPLRRQIVRDLKYIHKSLSPIFGIRRAQSLVSEGFRDGHALSLLLGYKKESELKEYGRNGETFYRYVWFAKDHLT
jgi:hypothetical protein